MVPVEWDTGKRVYEAKKLLQDHFLLLYGDNFVSFNLSKLFHFYNKKNSAISLILKNRSHGNVSLNSDGTIEKYDKTRQGKKLDFVELGYMLINKQYLFNHCNNSNISFSDVIAKCVSDKQVSGIVTEDNYYSISDNDRLMLTRKYLKNKKILLMIETEQLIKNLLVESMLPVGINSFLYRNI